MTRSTFAYECVSEVMLFVDRCAIPGGLPSSYMYYATLTFQLLDYPTSSSREVTILEITYCNLIRLELVDLSHLLQN